MIKSKELRNEIISITGTLLIGGALAYLTSIPQWNREKQEKIEQEQQWKTRMYFDSAQNISDLIEGVPGYVSWYNALGGEDMNQNFKDSLYSDYKASKYSNIILFEDYLATRKK